jgi:hypothetical protein
VVVNGDGVPQHVAHLARLDAVAQLAGLKEVAAEHGHAGEPLVVQLAPDRFERVVDMPAVANEDLHLRRAVRAEPDVRRRIVLYTSGLVRASASVRRQTGTGSSSPAMTDGSCLAGLSGCVGS